FSATLQKLVDDPAITITRAEGNLRPATPPSRLDTEMFAALERAAEGVFPGTVVIPVMTTGATDSAQLRAKGVQAYGIGTVSDGSNPAHGNDDRVAIAGIKPFLQF